MIWLIVTFIGYYLLYSIIKGAINNSRMARDIGEIKDLLKALTQDKINSSPPPVQDEVEEFHDWTDLNYLQHGSMLQAEVFHLLRAHKVFDILHEYDPILVGTVPIFIEIPSSDLDIICNVQHFTAFERVVKEHFEHYSGFTITRRIVDGIERVKANFTIEGWPIELFGQNKPTQEQNGFVHMIIEDRLLNLFGEPLRQAVIARKLEGMKTEPAFASLLQLEGDPYAALLKLADWTDEELRDKFTDRLPWS
ncbi:DUF4269 domain-containing protein [Paenibacillus cellulosilyticus]|uniref:DUF4269 domain-containing protein n=1 Tax=Paenibacillus cellulosilyticus TaxID=375489 RepID=UPI001FE406B8|nr:DUF4269 domain-containing protein [Paenibacillus cellulosilyticus]